MTAPQSNPSWPGYYPSAAYAPPPPPAPKKAGWATWMVIIGAFLATIVACVATALQAMVAPLIALAYDTYVPPATPTTEFFERVFWTLYASTFVSIILDIVALALSIVATVRQSAKMTLWVYAIVFVVCALCVGTWVTGFASIPSE